MKCSPIRTIALASTVALGLVSAIPAQADGLYSYDKGGVHVCIGLMSCLFRSDDSGRDRTVDHRDQGGQSTTVPSRRAEVRDHRATVRDHRTPPRDHRTQVRDHRN